MVLFLFFSVFAHYMKGTSFRYTYGLAGFFYLYDTYYLTNGKEALKRHPWMVLASFFTILAGAFICVAGTYVFIKVCDSEIFVEHE
jgi:hypothetical protein